jgi:hypothetical protein
VSAEGSDGSTGGAIVPLDETGPTVTFIVPFDGAAYVQGQPVLADYQCLDAGSGVQSCDGPVQTGEQIDTATPGVHTFTVQASDVAGNETSASVTYTVFVPCAGPDSDCDSVLDSVDNCVFDANPDQANNDRNFISNSPPYPAAINDRTRPNSDGFGDVCDPDDDNDGLTDVVEVSPQACASASGPTNPMGLDSDGDRFIDGMECVAGSDPADGLSQPAFFICGSTTDADTDGLSDRLETCFYNTDSGLDDTDGDRTVDGAKDGCEVASLNADRFVNSLDQGMLGAAIAGTVPYSVNVDINKDGLANSIDQGMIAHFVVPPGQCP